MNIVSTKNATLSLSVLERLLLAFELNFEVTLVVETGGSESW